MPLKQSNAAKRWSTKEVKRLINERDRKKTRKDK